MNWTDEQIQTIREMWERGETAEEIANCLGVLTYRVRRQTSAMGIKQGTRPQSLVESLHGEIWKMIPGSDTHSASNMGRIRGQKNLISPQKHVLGYRILRVRINGKSICKTVHSLVALTFLGPRPKGLDIAHLDHDKTNNALSNLKYATKKENKQGGYREDCKFINTEKVKEILKMADENKRLTNKEIGLRVGIGEEVVRRVRKGVHSMARQYLNSLK